MSEQNFGTIAALEFCVHPRQGFEDIVEDLDITFQPTGLIRRTLIWDGDDIAMIERDALRVLLGWLPPQVPGLPAYLMVAVGQSPNSPSIAVGPETCLFVKDVLLAHLTSYLPASRVLHKDTDQPVDADLMDDVADILTRDAASAAPWPHSGSDTAQPGAATSSPFDDTAPPEAEPADIIEAEFCDLSAQDESSLPKRLTIYTLGATMLLYTPPVGASLLVYATLRDLAPGDPLALPHKTAA